MSRLVTKGGLLASPHSAASDEVDCWRSEGRHRLKEGERRMRLRGREGMVMVVKDREEEGKGLSLKKCIQAV